MQALEPEPECGAASDVAETAAWAAGRPDRQASLASGELAALQRAADGMGKSAWLWKEGQYEHMSDFKCR